MLVTRRFGSGAVDHQHRLQPSIGNQAMLRLPARRGSSPTAEKAGSDHDQEADPTSLPGRTAKPALAWKFSKIPLFSPNLANRRQMPAPTAKLPLRGVILPTYAIGRVDDLLEHEADRIADQALRMSGPAPSIAAALPQINRKCVACEEGEKSTLQTKPAEAARPVGAVPPIVHEALGSAGQPLDPNTRAFMESRFGHDFSHVRVHTDPVTAQSARTINALAYTVGSDVVFAPQMYAPRLQEGRRLLAHELAHVTQQTKLARPMVQRKLDKITQSGCNFRFELGIGIYGPRAIAALATSWQSVINSHWTTDLICASNGNHCPVTMNSTVNAHPAANWLWQVPESNAVYVEAPGYRDVSAPLYKHWAADADDLTVTHETGHLMGLYDLYIGKYSLIPNDIMANYYVDPGPTQYSRALATILYDHKLGCACCSGAKATPPAPAPGPAPAPAPAPTSPDVS